MMAGLQFESSTRPFTVKATNGEKIIPIQSVITAKTGVRTELGRGERL